MRHQKIIELLGKPYLLQGELADIGLAIVLRIVEFQPDPKMIEKEERRREDSNDWTTVLEPKPRFSSWEYQKILEEGVRPLANREPFPAARVLIDAVASMIRLKIHRDEADGGGKEDHSEIWCRRLDRRGHEREGGKVALVEALVHACKAVHERAPESIHALDQALSNQRWKLFERLRQYLYATFPSPELLTGIREFVLLFDKYHDGDYPYEFQLMVRAACAHFGRLLLTDAEFNGILERIMSGPSWERYREWMGERYSDDAWEQRKRFYHFKQLRPFENILVGDSLRYYEQLQGEFTREKLNDDSYSPMGEARGGTISYRSPKSVQELQGLSDEELLTFINTWEDARRDADDWLVEVNFQGLAGAFQTVFKENIVPSSNRLKVWINNKSRIERPIYIKAMVEVMQGIVQSKQFELLHEWLPFCVWVLERPNPRFESEEFRSDDAREPQNWGSCRRAVGDFVGVCVSKEVQVPLEHRHALAQLLRNLCTDADYALDADASVLLNRDPITDAINQTRSRALESVVEFGFWLRRWDDGADALETREILDARFSNVAVYPLTLAERSLLSLNFPRIWMLNGDWAEGMKSQFFPRRDLHVWAEAFGAFIRYNHPYLRIYEVLRDEYVFALEHLKSFDDARGSEREVVDFLGQHLFTFYLWDVYPAAGENSLLLRYYEKTTDDRVRWGRLFDHVGRTLRNTERLDEKLSQRVREFFDWRVEAAEPLELQEFTFWLEAECLQADWRLDAFSKILDLATAKKFGLSMELDALNELLAQHTAKVVECFAKIACSFPAESAFYLRGDQVKPILIAGLKSGVEAVRSNAERARECLLNARRFEFLDL